MLLDNLNQIDSLNLSHNWINTKLIDIDWYMNYKYTSEDI